MKSETGGPGAAERKTLLAETLYRRILTLQLPPGSALNELALCEEFGLSRSTLRTSALQLAADGLLALRNNQAPVVTALPATLTHFQHSALLAYTTAARLAALNAGPADATVLGELLAELDQALEARALNTWLWLDNALLRQIARLAANDYLSPCLSRLHLDHGRLCHALYSRLPWQQLRGLLHHDGQAWLQRVEAIANNDHQGAALSARVSLETLCQRLHWSARPLHKESLIRRTTSRLY